MIGPDKADVRLVLDWLGFGPAFAIPAGLHGDKRRRLIVRHTRFAIRDGKRVGHALADAYGARSDDKRLLMLLRPQQLTDDLWRQVYALMVQGGPIHFSSLVRTLAQLTSPDTKAASREAEALYRAFSRICYARDAEHPEQEDSVDEADEADEQEIHDLLPDASQRGRGQPSKGDLAKRNVGMRLSPDVISALDAAEGSRDEVIRAGLVALGHLPGKE